MAAGVKHMLAVTGDGKLYSWGEGTNGRLGHGDQTTIAEPRISRPSKGKMVVAAAAGEEHSLAAASDGEMFAWGSGSFGKLGLGDPTDESTPRPVTAAAGHHVTAVACGYAHSVALCANYEVLVWGSGWKGKLGLGDNQNRATPTPIQMLKRKHELPGGVRPRRTTTALASRRRHHHDHRDHRRARAQLAISSENRHRADARSSPSPRRRHLVSGRLVAVGWRRLGGWRGAPAWRARATVDLGVVVGGGALRQLGIGGLDARLAPTEVESLAGKKVTQVACGTNRARLRRDVRRRWRPGATVLHVGQRRLRLAPRQRRVAEQETPVMILALTSTALTEPGGGGEGGDAASVALAHAGDDAASRHRHRRRHRAAGARRSRAT